MHRITCVGSTFVLVLLIFIVTPERASAATTASNSPSATAAMTVREIQNPRKSSSTSSGSGSAPSTALLGGTFEGDQGLALLDRLVVVHEQLEYPDAARVLGISEQNLRTTLHLARQRMKQLLEPYLSANRRHG